jgi:hypothetical protein
VRTRPASFLLASMFLCLTLGTSVLAQGLKTPMQICPATYPSNPEEILADRVIEFLSETGGDDKVLEEAKKLKTADGQKQVREYLEENIERGTEEEKAYEFCLLLKQFRVALGEQKRKQLEIDLRGTTDSETRRCIPFLCIFHLCSC